MDLRRGYKGNDAKPSASDCKKSRNVTWVALWTQEGSWYAPPGMTIPEIFDAMPSRYKKGSATSPRSFYFSVGDHKYTVKIDGDVCSVESGKTIDNADVVLKTTPALFEKMVVKGKMPGPIDIARGKIKTNDPGGLAALREWFDFA